MRPLLYGAIATVSFIVASVGSSLITTAVRPDKPGDLKEPVEQRIGDPKPPIQKVKEPEKTSTPEVKTEQQQPAAPEEAPTVSAAPAPKPPAPAPRGPGNIDAPPPPRPATRGPGNLDEPYYPPSYPTQIGPGNL